MKIILSIWLSGLLLLAALSMPGQERAIRQESGEGAEILEAVSEERQEQVRSEDVKLDGEEGNIVFEKGESVDYMEKPGYHIVPSREINCMHTPSTINASIKCKSAANPLNPKKDELLNNIELTGKLKGKRFTAQTVADDQGGKDNTVTHLRLEANVQAPGINKTLLAGPYVCGDGYAAYAYFEIYYSYCPNQRRFCHAGESHVWLGCKGGDEGTVEFHPTNFHHKFMLYKTIPNQYKIKYHANGGSGTVSSQNAIYDTKLSLRAGAKYKRAGYTLTGWNTKSDGRGTRYDLGEEIKNLTSENGGEITLYAQWRLNTLTVRYNANGGQIDQSSGLNTIESFTSRWNYKTAKKQLVNFSSLRLSRSGYTRLVGAEWNTKPDGSGKAFDQELEYEMLDYAPNLKDGDQEIILYAQWKPNVYTITLNHGLTNPSRTGTDILYKTFERGLFFDRTGSKKFAAGQAIDTPEKAGYLFRGYYTMKKSVGDVIGSHFIKKMIDSDGLPTAEALDRQGIEGNETWYAWYDYQIGCEDYADIPCDITKEAGDIREDFGVRLSYDSDARNVLIHTMQPGCEVSLTAQPSQTKIGNFQSSLSAGSASGSTGNARSVKLPLTVPEGAAYRLKVEKEEKPLCDRLIYFQDGRFRTLVKLGEKDAEEAETGGSLAGSAWGTYDTEYDLYRYDGCSRINNIQGPGNVQRYYRYKDVNMAYNGNGATSGKNILEYDVSLEDMYWFRDNPFTKEKTEKKHTNAGKKYECKVRYCFQGWEMSDESQFTAKDQRKMASIYLNASEKKVIATGTTEDIGTYEEAYPICILPGAGVMDASLSNGTLPGVREVQPKYAAPQSSHANEYINLRAKWDSCPTIVVTPGEKMEFYEGEKVTKEKLIRRLTAHDNEDNKDLVNHPNLNHKLRIVQVSYPQTKQLSQMAYEKVYGEDVPEGFLLDTYYLKLEKGEVVTVLVTFAVTDSTGNTTQEQIPVKIKYNNYPQISSENVFYYLKEEANRGEITAAALIRRASAKDEEDGDVTWKLKLKNFDPQAMKMQTESKAEFEVTYQVTDAYQKTSHKTVQVIVWDEAAVKAEAPRCYVRYISQKYLHTLEENSAWREPENFAYLKSILSNHTPVETWRYTHEDVLAVQDWITEGGQGHWKLGQEINQKFLSRFAHCRQ